MPNTELMVVTGQSLMKHDNTEVAAQDNVEEIEYSADDAEFAQDNFEEVQRQVASLEMRLAADTERCETLIKKLNVSNAPLIANIERLHADLLAKQEAQAKSDDLEDQLEAEERKKAMDALLPDTEHETQDNEGDADSEAVDGILAAMDLHKRCGDVYRAIARGTHPDKCRHLPKDVREERNRLFIEARKAMDDLNYDLLEEIHMKVFAKAHSVVNLIERLMMARQRREQLRLQIEELRGTSEWQLFCLALRYGESVADEQYRKSLEQTLEGLTRMLNPSTSPNNWTWS